MVPRLSIFLLGPLEVRLDGEPLSGFEYNKVRALLAYLAVEAGRPQARASLCDLLWPEMPENAARQNLSQALSQLRKVLGDKQAATPYLLTNIESVQLNPAAPVDVDAARFTALISHAETHPHRAWHLCSPCAEKLRQAVSLYHGDFLAHFYVSDSVGFEEWAVLLRERLRQQMLSALERLTRYFEWRGAHDQAVEIARTHVEMEPWRDTSHRELMRLLALSGQHSAALAQYAHLKRTLKAELDLEPEPETTELIEKIRASAPPGSLRCFQSPISKLPLPPMPLIGRATDLNAVKGLFNEGVRLLTITGAPGVGKTRFALEIAAQMRFDFEEGAHFVDLTPVPDAAYMPGTLAQVLGVKEQAGRTLTALIKSHLRNKHLLLVLDNFENVIEAAPFVADLLAACPELKVLVTSRSALRVRAEQIHLLAPLEAAEAVRLFTERARAVRTDFALKEENAETIAVLCQYLDNLPLGIELVAVRARTFSPTELLRQLDSRLEAQQAGSRDLPERQSTLRNAIAWSYDRLRADEQHVFAHLGVFLGGCTVEAAQAVVGEGLPIPLLLEALVEASLVQSQTTEHETRFTLLETLREFALEQLAARGETDAARQRHASYFLALAERAEPALFGPTQKTWLDQLTREHENLHAALTHASRTAGDAGLRLAAALHRFWEIRGHFTEGRSWLAQMLAQHPDAAMSLRAKTLDAAASLATRQGDYTGAYSLYEQALRFFYHLEDSPAIANTLRGLGIVADNQGNFALARSYFEQSLDIARQSGDARGIAVALNNLGWVADQQGDYARARALYQECLPIAREVGDKIAIANTLLNLGLTVEQQGESVSARALMEESLSTFRDIGHKSGIALVLLNLGNLAESQTDLALAEGYFSESLKLRHEANEKRPIARNLDGLAQVDWAQGQPARAARLFGAAEALRESLGIPILPIYLPEHQREVAAVRTALGETAFEKEWAAGRALTLEQAVALALLDDD